ncbi:uncharacterized protein [Bactrocera oleae]|uniref:uncharacterized protein n=1 Tax=Bactrocera oleae TaxID=104688 RepID=UPI00387E439C
MDCTKHTQGFKLFCHNHMYVFSHFDIYHKEFKFKREKEKITIEKKKLENKHGVLLATDELRNRINNLAKKYRFIPKRKRNNDEDFLEPAKKKQKIMEEYFIKFIKNEEKALDLMEQTNTIPLAILNKNT